MTLNGYEKEVSGHQNIMAVNVAPACAYRHKGKLQNNCHNGQSPDKYLNSRPLNTKQDC
jgi:hypothetical protein